MKKFNGTIAESYDKVLTESSLSRIYKHISEHDCACITAFRGQKIHCLKSIDDKPEGSVYTNSEKLARNAKLYTILMGFNYGVTKIDGTFIENFGKQDEKREVKEDTLFVVNLHDDADFIKNIINLGKQYCQDSVLIKERGTDNAYLYGTNNMVNDDGTANLDTKTPVGYFHGGIKSVFMSRVSGRPFAFTEGNSYNLMTRGYFFEKNKQEFLRGIV